LELNEVDLIAASAAKIDKLRRATLVDGKASLDQERKDLGLQRSTEIRGGTHAS
jgi:hypothetical protein